MRLDGNQVTYIINDNPEPQPAFTLDNPDDYKIAFSLLDASVKVISLEEAKHEE